MPLVVALLRRIHPYEPHSRGPRSHPPVHSTSGQSTAGRAPTKPQQLERRDGGRVAGQDTVKLGARGASAPIETNISWGRPQLLARVSAAALAAQPLALDQVPACTVGEAWPLNSPARETSHYADITAHVRPQGRGGPGAQ